MRLLLRVGRARLDVQVALSERWRLADGGGRLEVLDPLPRGWSVEYWGDLEAAESGMSDLDWTVHCLAAMAADGWVGRCRWTGPHPYWLHHDAAHAELRHVVGDGRTLVSGPELERDRQAAERAADLRAALGCLRAGVDPRPVLAQLYRESPVRDLTRGKTTAPLALYDLWKRTTTT